MRNDQILDLHLERLEDRQMLAGDVSVMESNGDLVINGDSDGNELLVIARTSGNFEVRGVDGTTINGKSSVFITGISDDVRINLRSGDNSIFLSGINDPFAVDDIKITSRAGNDVLMLDSVSISGKLQVSTSGGDDAVFINASDADSVNIRTGGGHDVALNVGLEVAGKSTFKFGQGDDAFLTSGSEYRDNAKILFAGGDDFGGSSNDVFDDDLRLNYGSGTDVLMGDTGLPSIFNGNTNATGYESTVAANGFLGALGEFESAVQARNLDDVFVKTQDLYNEL